MNIKEIIAWVAPIAAGFITSVVIPFIIKRHCLKKLQKKIDEVNSGEEFKVIKNDIAEIKKEIYLMRGKRK